MPRRPKAAQPASQSVYLTEPTEEELLAQLEQATNDDLNFNTPTTNASNAPANSSNEQTPAARTKRKYTKNSGIYARPQEYDDDGNPIAPGYEYAALSLTGPRRRPDKEPTPPPSLDPHGRPWLYPKKTRQGEGSNLKPFASEIKQWIEEGQSSRMIAEILIARGVETSDRHVAKQRLKMGFRQRAKRKLTDEAIANMRKAKQSVAKPLPTKGDVSVRRVRIRDMRQAEITRLTKEGLSAEEIAENLSLRGINMRSGAPTVKRLQKQWGLVEGDNTNLLSIRTHARHEATRRQREQLTNVAQELGITDVDDWVTKKMEEPQMMDARRRFAYELMGDAKPAIALAGIEAAVARSRRARDKRQFLAKLAQAGGDQADRGNSTSEQPSATPSDSPSGAPQAIDTSDGEDESSTDSEDGQNDEDEDREIANGDEEDENEENDNEENEYEDEEEGMEEATEVTSNQVQQAPEPMEVDAPNPAPQQPAPAPFHAGGQNDSAIHWTNSNMPVPPQALQHNPFRPPQYSQPQDLHLSVGVRVVQPPSQGTANGQIPLPGGFSQAKLAPAPTRPVQNRTRPGFVNIAPRPEKLPTPPPAPPPPASAPKPAASRRSNAIQSRPSKRSLNNIPPPTVKRNPPPVSHLDSPPSESITPSQYWQPKRGQADFMAQHYGLFPFKTPSPKQHTYTTTSGLIITMGFEYLAAPPTPDAQMIMVPNAYIPPELQPQVPPRPQLNAWGKAPKYPPIVVPSVPVPAMAIPTDEAEKHKGDQKILEKIQKLSDECIKMMSARANNQLLEHSLTGLPPSRFDIKNAKKRLKEAADALVATD